MSHGLSSNPLEVFLALFVGLVAGALVGKDVVTVSVLHLPSL